MPKQTTKYQTCSACGQSIGTRYMRIHWRTVHAYDPPARKKHVPRKSCPVCKALFHSEELEAHLKIGHKPDQSSKGMTFTLDESGVFLPVHTENESTIKNVLNYKKPTSHKYEVCPVCQTLIESDEMEFHVRAAHPVTPAKEGVPIGRNGLGPLRLVRQTVFVCPICKVKLRSAAKLEKHSAIHSKSKSQAKQNHKNANKANSRQVDTRNNISSKVGKGWREGGTSALEALRQSSDEPRDGSKGFGHMRREGDGKFGSFPLYDDYDDESEA